jgi:hypothetical protein
MIDFHMTKGTMTQEQGAELYKLIHPEEVPEVTE